MLMTSRASTLQVAPDSESAIDNNGPSLHANGQQARMISLHSMNNFELADHCMREIENYRQGRPFDEQYGLELFQRALQQCDPSAWEAVQQRFSDIVLCWFRNHPLKQATSYFDSEENYVAQTFARFWQATAGKQSQSFTTLAAILRYLRASLGSTLLDTLRAYSRPHELALPEPHSLNETSITAFFIEEEQDENLEVWEAIRSILPNGRQQQVAYLLFYCHLKPREIVRFCPQEFSSVGEIYRLRRSISNRLLRNASYLRWRLACEPV